VNDQIEVSFAVTLFALVGESLAQDVQLTQTQEFTVSVTGPSVIEAVRDSENRTWTTESTSARIELPAGSPGRSFDVTVVVRPTEAGISEVALEGEVTYGRQPLLLSTGKKKAAAGGRSLSPPLRPRAIVTPTAIYHLLDQNAVGGLGHSAVIVPDPQGCMYFEYSTNGKVTYMRFNHIDDDLRSAKMAKYTHWQKWDGVDLHEANAAKLAALRFNNTDYHVNNHNCWHMVFAALEAAGTAAQNFGSDPGVNYNRNLPECDDAGGL
jgi:hypothetical protein